MPRKAKARLLYSTISTSERIADLCVRGALIYTWLLAHCDDQGRYSGSSRKVKAEVVPLIDEISNQDVEQALEAMEHGKVITRYADHLIQISDWWEFQSGLTYKNPSRYPAPEGWKDKVKMPPERGRDAMGKYKLLDTDTGEIFNQR